MSFWEDYPQLRSELLLVEKCMLQNIKSRKKILTNIAQELVQSGGKRLRPAFVILGAKFGKKYNKNRQFIIKIAASIELVHTATLVHDDIIDESTFRRGKESIYSKWGSDMALYTGDYLFTRAFMLLSNKTDFTRLNYVAEAMKAICEGEVDQYESKKKYNINVFEYLKRIFRKTTILFVMSMLVGAYESNCDKSIMRILKKYSFSFGMAFQIRDDLLDYISTEEEMGKPIGLDIKQGIYTLPIIYALKDKKYGDKIRKIIDNKKISDEEIVLLVNYIKKTNAIEKAKLLQNKFLNRAYSSLDELKDTFPTKAILYDLLKKLSI